MYLLITTLISGILISYFATQNTSPVDVYIGSYTFTNIPLYIVVLFSALAPLFICILLYVAKSLSDSLTISELQDKLKDTEVEKANIAHKAHKLEIENARLTTLYGYHDTDVNGF